MKAGNDGYKGCNVHTGKYGKGKSGGDMKRANGTFDKVPKFAGGHRQSEGVLTVKGHHRKG
jgi:hypothetical protein